MELAHLNELINKLSLSDAQKANRVLDTRIRYLNERRMNDIFTSEEQGVTCYHTRNDGNGGRCMRSLDDHNNFYEWIQLYFTVGELDILFSMDRRTEMDTRIPNDEIEIQVRIGKTKISQIVCASWLFPGREAFGEIDYDERVLEEIKNKFGEYFDAVEMCMNIIQENKDELPFEEI